MQLINDMVANVMVWFMALGSEKDDEKGQTLVEYALIIALMSIALVVSLGLLKGGVEGVFNKIIAKLNVS